MRRSGCQRCQGIGDKRRLLAWHTQLACSSFYLLAGNLQETQIGCQHFQMRHCLTASHMMPTNLSCLHTRTPTAMFRCLGPMQTAETAKRKSLLSTTRRMFSSSNDEMKMQSINLRITNFTAIVARLLDPEALQTSSVTPSPLALLMTYLSLKAMVSHDRPHGHSTLLNFDRQHMRHLVTHVASKSQECRDLRELTWLSRYSLAWNRPMKIVRSHRRSIMQQF